MIKKHIIAFNENLIGLREFVELIDPILTQRIKEHNKHIRPILLSAIAKDILENDKGLDAEAKEKIQKVQLELQMGIAEKYSKIPDVIIQKPNNETGEQYVIQIEVTEENNIDKHLENVSKNIGHINLLYTNALISCLSSVEWFFSQILHVFYNNYPDSAGVQKRTMTLTDLKSFDSISDAEKYLIDLKIDEILRGSFDGWITFLKTELKFGLSYLTDLTDELIEIYQRRNLFVHNGGIVNSIYLSKVDENFRENISVDERLSVDKEYLDNSICKLQKAFILVGSELWKKIEPANSKRGDVLTDIVYENLLHGRWDISEGLCYFILNDANCNPVDKVIAQLNYWLCQKELGNFKKIEMELERTDYSDKKEIFQLGLNALKNDIDNFFALLPIALDTKQINIERLEEFPIFREIRETYAYKDFKENSKYFKEQNQKVEKAETIEKE